MSRLNKFQVGGLTASIFLVVGILFGSVMLSQLKNRYSDLRFQKVIMGYVNIETPRSTGPCPSYPENDYQLSSLIITDGITNGYALGHKHVYETGLEPHSGDCSYYLEFPIKVSSTGDYFLHFSWTEDIELLTSGKLTFKGEVGLDALSPKEIGFTEAKWFLTTRCPSSQLICPQN